MICQQIIVLIGPSGCGKTTLGLRLKELGITQLVSHTTRPIRAFEVPDVHYHFVTRAVFETIQFIETNEYAKEWYGVSHKEVASKLFECPLLFVTLDINGARHLKAMYPDLVRICFIQASDALLETRMRQRGDREEQIKTRLLHMKEQAEQQYYKEADVIIDNTGTLESAWEQLLAVVPAWYRPIQ